MIADDLHVVPLNDLREHESGRACWCGPMRDDDEPDVWLHKSMDRREYTKEQGKMQ